ncbi:MAG: LLM class F420-dependent oxidoreductase [Pseudomonadales bacterium]|nr:LLM class F420-dependent oxidoreductase [Pseudomonadales bacterium]
MRTGIMLGADGPADTIDEVIARAKAIEAAGFDDIWMANIFGLDAITTLGLIGRETKTIGLGTAVTPTYPRHPSAIAQQAMTTNAASNGRFTLGIGLSHQVVIEGMLGFSYDKPARHMKEYLSILAPLLRGEMVNYSGEQYRVNNLAFSIPGAGTTRLLVAALGPVMLNLAGKLADGTVTWMTGPNTLSSHIIPKISEGAESAGKPAPSVAAGFPIALTEKVDDTKAFISKSLQIYGQLPSYRAMLDKEGIDGPADLAIVGDENKLRTEIERLRSIGVTHFCGAISAPDKETYDRTFEFLASL